MTWSQMQRAYYDGRARLFDRAHFGGRANRNHFKKIAAIATELDLSAGNNVLEVGAGTGIHSQWLLQTYADIRVTGVDISTAMLQVARGRVAEHAEAYKRIELCSADGEHLPFFDDQFDAVFCSGTLHHVADQRAMVIEMTRVVKPGHPVAVMEPNWLFPTSFLAAFMTPAERNILRMRPRNLVTWAREAGWRGIRVRPVLYSPPAPRLAFSLYDALDGIGPKLPLLRWMSVMLLLSGCKASDANPATFPGPENDEVSR